VKYQPFAFSRFEVSTIMTFDPVDAEAMRAAWPAFRAFGHVKQFLNPARYPMFKRRLKRVQAPAHPSPPRHARAERRELSDQSPAPDPSPPPSTLTSPDN
jgi:hypothetical protein